MEMDPNEGFIVNLDLWGLSLTDVICHKDAVTETDRQPFDRTHPLRDGSWEKYLQLVKLVTLQSSHLVWLINKVWFAKYFSSQFLIASSH